MKSTRCAACKHMRKKCPPDCIFAPHFPYDNPNRYACVHKYYGASNVARMLKDVPEKFRATTADVMYFEAQWRDDDPVYGCVKIITELKNQISKAENELARTQAEIQLLVASMGDGTVFDPSFDCSSG